MAMLLAARVKQLPIIGLNPSQPHVLEKIGGRRRTEEGGGQRKAMGGGPGFSAP